MTAAEQAGLDAELSLQLEDAEEPLRGVCRYALQGGRRVRAALLLAAAPRRGDVAIKAAAALELMHTATLLQDDIFDGGRMRRGQLAAHVRFGNAQAVLASDWLLIASLQLALHTGPEYFRCLARTGKTMTQAEARELDGWTPQSLEEAERVCFEIARGKTGALFGAALCGAASALQLDGEQHTCWSSLGNELGLTYQLVDDCMDNYGNESRAGKSVGHDVAAGCLTLPVLLGAASLTGIGRRLTLHAMRAGRLSAGDHQALLEAIESTGVKDELLRVIEGRLAAHTAETLRLGLANRPMDAWLAKLLENGRGCLLGDRFREATPSADSMLPFRA